MELLPFILIPNAVYLALATLMYLWIRHETGKLVDEQKRPLRLLSASILFAPGLFISGHSILPGFALGTLIVELYLGDGRLTWPAWQLGLTIGPMLLTYAVLWGRGRLSSDRTSTPP